MDVCVVGLGKIGLPLAVQFADSGHRVIGADLDPGVVAKINDAVAPFPGEAGLDERLGPAIERGALWATTDTTDAVAHSEVVVVVVPLIVDAEHRPAFGALDAATEDIGRGLRPGTLVSYETTLPVGTTRNRFTPRLAELSGLTPGVDLHVCFSPERVYSGRIFADLRRYPKIVGGISPESTAAAVRFYTTALQFDPRDDLGQPNGVWDVGTAEAAELVKLAETTYRDVNLALANEFARFAQTAGIDIHAVIAAANSQPFSHIHSPGISIGGHCIPVYPHLYLSTHPDALLPRASREANTAMPTFAVDRLATMIDLAGAKVAVLGLCYRGGVKETAFSGTYSLVPTLESRGAHVRVHDPLFTDDELAAEGFEPHHLGEPVDAVIVHTDHAEYAGLGPAELPGARAIFDGRGVLDRDRFADIAFERLGVGP